MPKVACAAHSQNRRDRRIWPGGGATRRGCPLRGGPGSALRGSAAPSRYRARRIRPMPNISPLPGLPGAAPIAPCQRCLFRRPLLKLRATRGAGAMPAARLPYFRAPRDRPKPHTCPRMHVARKCLPAGFGRIRNALRRPRRMPPRSGTKWGSGRTPRRPSPNAHTGACIVTGRQYLGPIGSASPAPNSGGIRRTGAYAIAR